MLLLRARVARLPQSATAGCPDEETSRSKRRAKPRFYSKLPPKGPTKRKSNPTIQTTCTCEVLDLGVCTHFPVSCGMLLYAWPNLLVLADMHWVQSVMYKRGNDRRGLSRPAPLTKC